MTHICECFPETHTRFPEPLLNAPYTAERGTTTYQKLADGASRSPTARDSLGSAWPKVEVQNKEPLRRDGKKFSAWIIFDPFPLIMTHWCHCNHVAWCHISRTQPKLSLVREPTFPTCAMLSLSAKMDS